MMARHVHLEPLELRLLWSASAPIATLNSGLLTVPGTAQADTIAATQSSGNIIISLNGASDTFAAPDVQEISIRGDPGADSISIDPSITIPVTLAGGGGADSLRAGGGNETLLGGGGNDSLIDGSGIDSMYGGRGTDTLATGATSVIAGALSVQGTAAADVITVTEPGSEIAVDFNGTTDSIASSLIQSIVIRGGAGSDIIRVNSAIQIPESLFGGRGDDTMFAGSGPATLNGGGGNDSLVAGSFGDSLVGGGGNNVLFGGTGNDILYAINGQVDTVIGGGGTDVAHVDMGLDSVAGVSHVLFS
jgi:Ca2+-binding RTX toxin-like protein